MRKIFDRSSPFGKIIGRYIERMLFRSLKRNLRSVYLKGELIAPPFVLAMNHHSFFDGHFVWLLFKRFGVCGSLLVSSENFRAFPMLEAIGLLPASRIREAVRRLKNGEAVAIFPEGELRPAGSLGQLKRGVVWLAEKAGVPIVPVASRVFQRGYENPEGFLLIGSPLSPDLNALKETLESLISELDKLYITTKPRKPFQGFSLILLGRLSLDERLNSRWGLLREILREILGLGD
ncbi:MAG: 1-acyl-sn-glycerol-3-phosphate acyltransferase [Armatimonadetes bacterium]|nr:1-acyl-sn-glycerol-3-phosphate acyltransferase [Armatimonadota bacterium]MDW8028427.1 lysophospholipid acyltransferase family protein [Armatimonadota bacterium]